MLPCDICSKLGHAWFNCPERQVRPKDFPPGWKPARLTKSSGGSSEVERQPSKLGVGGSNPPRRSKKSTAARKDVQQGRRGPGVGEPTTEQSGLAMPSSREIGRPPMSPAGTQALPVDTLSRDSSTSERRADAGSTPAPGTKSSSGEAAHRARKRPQRDPQLDAAASPVPTIVAELREKSAEIINKGGRPRKHADRKAYKAQMERERRARRRAEKEGTSNG